MNKLMLALTLFALSAVTTATADDCTTAEATPAGDYYIAIDDPTAEDAGIWIYEESNGQAGLQRDSAGGDPHGDAACDSPDTIIF